MRCFERKAVIFFAVFSCFNLKSASVIETNFELVNRTNKLIFYHLGVKLDYLLEEIGPKKWVSKKIDPSKTQSLLISIDRHPKVRSIVDCYTFSEGRTIFVKLIKKGNTFSIKPQEDSIEKSQHGYSIKKNVKVVDITHFRVSYYPKKEAILKNSVKPVVAELTKRVQRYVYKVESMLKGKLTTVVMPPPFHVRTLIKKIKSTFEHILQMDWPSNDLLFFTNYFFRNFLPLRDLIGKKLVSDFALALLRMQAKKTIVEKLLQEQNKMLTAPAGVYVPLDDLIRFVEKRKK